MPRGKHGSCKKEPRRSLYVAPSQRLTGSVPLAPGGSAAMSRNGFTLIELLIVVVIIGLLATIAIPKFANTKEKAFVGTMKSDLRNLATAEEAFFYDSAKYTTDFTLMNNFRLSSGVNVGSVMDTATGWSASLTNT